jgi:hypothetical protein
MPGHAPDSQANGSLRAICFIVGLQGSLFDIGSRRCYHKDEQLPVSPEHNRNFIDCVKSREETMCPLEMAIRCDAICQLANIAALTGRAIQWDPEQEKIVNDSEAAKLLVRPNREKWKVW